MSRYDYRDPGTDPAYCEGLEAKDDIDSETPVFCIWCCVTLVEPEHYPYCSTFCAVQAEAEGA